MRNVSFKKVIYNNQIKDLTYKQIATTDVINNILSAKNKNNTTLSKEIRKKLYSDILVTNLKDGNTKISIVPCGKKGPRIKIPDLIINNRKFLLEICEQVEQFAANCIGTTKI